MTTLPEDYLLFIYLYYMLCLFPCDLNTTLMVIYYQFYCDSGLSWQFRLFSRLPPLRLLSVSFVVSPRAFRSLSCSSWIISDHCRNPSSCCFTQQWILSNVSKCYYVCHWCRHLTLFESPFRRKRIITSKYKCSIMFNITKQGHKLKTIACFLQIFFIALHQGTKYLIHV